MKAFGIESREWIQGQDYVQSDNDSDSVRIDRACGSGDVEDARGDRYYYYVQEHDAWNPLPTGTIHQAHQSDEKIANPPEDDFGIDWGALSCSP